METLLKVSEADSALAKRRERVWSTLAESKECSRAMMLDTAGVQTTRAILYSGDVGFDHPLCGVGIFTKGSAGPRPPRICGQIGLWRE